MGVVPPEAGFLEAIVRLCKENGAVSIFDEVMTGSRVARGGDRALRQVARRDARARSVRPPSQYEAVFSSTAHTEADVDATIAAASEAFGAAV